MACRLNTAGHKAKQSEIWDSGVLVELIWDTFAIVVFKVILESVGAVVSKWPVTQKLLVIEKNREKHVTRGY